jgi:3-methyladenine DNA glycosylase/8-oxoguanine DNA glycosylase
VNLARSLEDAAFPTMEELERLEPDEARKGLLELPGIGDYSADIVKRRRRTQMQAAGYSNK